MFRNFIYCTCALILLCSFISPSSLQVLETCDYPKGPCFPTSPASDPTSVSLVYYPLSYMDRCAVNTFCSTRKQGRYCYTSGGNCFSTAIIECPWGLVSACERGYVCQTLIGGVACVPINTANSSNNVSIAPPASLCPCFNKTSNASVSQSLQGSSSSSQSLQGDSSSSSQSLQGSSSSSSQGSSSSSQNQSNNEAKFSDSFPVPSRFVGRFCPFPFSLPSCRRRPPVVCTTIVTVPCSTIFPTTTTFPIPGDIAQLGITGSGGPPIITTVLPDIPLSMESVTTVASVAA